MIEGEYIDLPYEKVITYTRAYKGAKTSLFKYYVGSEKSGTFPGLSDYMQYVNNFQVNFLSRYINEIEFEWRGLTLKNNSH